MHNAVKQCRIAARLIVLSLSTALLGLGAMSMLAQPVAAEQSVRATYQSNTIASHTSAGNSVESLAYSSVISFYLPFMARHPTPTPTAAPYACSGIPGAVYNSIIPNPPPTDRPAAEHADLNIALRNYVATAATLGLINYGGATDPSAPQLYSLFQDNRTPAFRTNYRVYDWDWGCNCRGSLLSNWPVTLAGLSVTPGEIIRVPNGGYDIGLTVSGYEVLVLYATSSRITLKYTREDNVVYGYTVHLENVCVDPGLLDLYNQTNAAGRVRLPALISGQSFGRALTNELGVAIRDSGTFMDPRSCKDWWQGRC